MAAEQENTTSQPAAAAEVSPAVKAASAFIWATGRRKTAVARVRIKPGAGEFKVNKRKMEEYFVAERDRNAATSPMEAAQAIGSWDVFVNVHGGGPTGQAGAVMLGLARALCKALPDVESTLREHGMLTRDARMKERKKYGQRGARRRFQFSKR